MQKTRLKKSLSLIVCMVLIVAIALFTTGCNGSNDTAGTASDTAVQTETTQQAEEDAQTADTDDSAATEDSSAATEDASDETDSNAVQDEAQASESTENSDTESSTADTAADGNVLGEGATSFTFTVKDAEGNETVYQINTDQKTVGAALLDLGLIAGEESEYGLYVKTVNGSTVDYDTDGKYWAFYVDGAYASTGVDSTDITPGATYSFIVE